MPRRRIWGYRKCRKRSPEGVFRLDENGQRVRDELRPNPKTEIVNGIKMWKKFIKGWDEIKEVDIVIFYDLPLIGGTIITKSGDEVDARERDDGIILKLAFLSLNSAIDYRVRHRYDKKCPKWSR